MMRVLPSWRIVMVVALTLGYMVLGVTLGGGSLVLAYYSSQSEDPYYHMLYLFFIVAGTVVVVGFLPGGSYAIPDGERVEPQEQRQFFGLVNGVASRTGQRMPDEIYLVFDRVNAFIFHSGGILRGKRILCVSLPLFHLLTVSQLQGIVAHEFGHLDRGNIRIGAWIHLIQSGLRRTINMLGPDRDPKSRVLRMVRLPFVLYSRLVLYMTVPMFRIQELAADRLAAETVGSYTYGEALRIVHQNCQAFDAYVIDSLLPMLGRGYLPPVMEGYARYLEFTGRKYDEPARKPDDVHPPFAERLAAIADLPAIEAENNLPASSILNNGAELQVRLLRTLLPEEGPKDFTPVSWHEAGQLVIIPDWKRRCSRERLVLRDVTLGSLRSTVAAADKFDLFAAAFGLALYREGWQLDHEPGYLWLRRGDFKINPHDLVEEMRSPEFTEDAWREMLTKFGLDTGTLLTG